MQFGDVSGLSAVVYGLVGVAGVYQALALASGQRSRTAALAGGTR
jgi:uncharacterized membrane protein YuzA (DUF378 family)